MLSPRVDRDSLGSIIKPMRILKSLQKLNGERACRGAIVGIPVHLCEEVLDSASDDHIFEEVPGLFDQ